MGFALKDPINLVEYASVLVSVDARLPNPLFAEALNLKQWPDFHYPTVEREVTYGQSRLDFRLSGPDESLCWVETKTVTLVDDGLAMFPDAPTSRGRRHLHELIHIRSSEQQAAVVFIVQRPDARAFQPHRQADPEFATTLSQAAADGVLIKAYTCHVSRQEITIAGEIPVHLP